VGAEIEQCSGTAQRAKQARGRDSEHAGTGARPCEHTVSLVRLVRILAGIRPPRSPRPVLQGTVRSAFSCSPACMHQWCRVLSVMQSSPLQLAPRTWSLARLAVTVFPRVRCVWRPAGTTCALSRRNMFYRPLYNIGALTPAETLAETLLKAKKCSKLQVQNDALRPDIRSTRRHLQSTPTPPHVHWPEPCDHRGA